MFDRSDEITSLCNGFKQCPKAITGILHLTVLGRNQVQISRGRIIAFVVPIALLQTANDIKNFAMNLPGEFHDPN